MAAWWLLNSLYINSTTHSLYYTEQNLPEKTHDKHTSTKRTDHNVAHTTDVCTCKRVTHILWSSFCAVIPYVQVTLLNLPHPYLSGTTVLLVEVPYACVTKWTHARLGSHYPKTLHPPLYKHKHHVSFRVPLTLIHCTPICSFSNSSSLYKSLNTILVWSKE